MGAVTNTGADDKEYAGDVVRLFEDHMDDAVRAGQGDWRLYDCDESYAFVAGNGQWDAASVQELKRQKRPVITFNRVQPIINAVVGHHISMRESPRYLPRTLDDQALNDLMNEAARWAVADADADMVDTAAFRDLVICGLGVVESRIDFEDDPDGRYVRERIWPGEFYWDPSAQSKNMADARWMARAREMTKDEVRGLLGEDAVGVAHAANPYQPTRIGDGGGNVRAYEMHLSARSQRRDTYWVFEYQWCEKKAYYRVANPLAYGLDISPEAAVFLQRVAEIAQVSPRQQDWMLKEKQYTIVKKAFDVYGIPMQAASIKRKVYYKCFISNGRAYHVTEMGVDGFTWSVMTGEYDEDAGYWYGMVRAMKDPQRYANKAFSQLLHVINSNAKGGYFVRANAVEDVRSFNRTALDPMANTEVIDESGVIPKAQPQLPTGYEQILQLAQAGIRDTSGVPLELLGMTDKEQAGVLEAQRIQQGVTGLASFFDAYRAYVRDTGRKLASIIRELALMRPGRIVRLLGEQSRAVPLLADNLAVEYDIIVDQAPMTANMKQQYFEATQELIARLGERGQALVPMLLEFAAVPESLREQMLQAMQQQQDPQMQRMQMRGAEAEIAKTESEALENQANAEYKRAQAAEAAHDMQMREFSAMRDIAQQ